MECPCSLNFFGEEKLLDGLCGDRGRGLEAYYTLIARSGNYEHRSLSIEVVNES